MSALNATEQSMMEKIDREKIMQQWDSWRKYIANGGTGSWPRDAFEALLDCLDERLENKIRERFKHIINSKMKESTINKIEALNRRLQSGGFSWHHEDYFLLQACLPEIIEMLKKPDAESEGE